MVNAEEVLGEPFNHGYLVMFANVYIFFLKFALIRYVREKRILISDIMT